MWTLECTMSVLSWTWATCLNVGVAFKGLDDIEEPLYPIICSTAAKTEMGLGVTKREFISIQDRCRTVILRHLSHEDQIEQLELPRTLKRFISEGLSEESQEDIDLTKNNRSWSVVECNNPKDMRVLFMLLLLLVIWIIWMKFLHHFFLWPTNNL